MTTHQRANMTTNANPSDGHPIHHTRQSSRFDPHMYAAALAYYGLPANYDCVFKQIGLTDRETQKPLLKPDGSQRTTLRSCRAAEESSAGQVVWIQINPSRQGAARRTPQGGTRSYPKKPNNEDIGTLQNITLDFEYPAHPHIAHSIGLSLAAHLVSIGLAAEGLPVEDSGAGCHIVLPLPPIAIGAEDAERWNSAVANLVHTFITPEFKQLCEYHCVSMDLGGYDLSRVLSAPGTWRPRNPKKDDCEALHAGYLRRWLPPYTNRHYPVRQESLQLAERLHEAYQQVRETQPLAKGGQARQDDQASEWLNKNAGHYYQQDRSAYFHALVAATYLKYGDQVVRGLASDIDRLSGEKYGERLQKNLERSLEKAIAGGREETPRNIIKLPPRPPSGDGEMERPIDHDYTFSLTDLGNAERFASQHRQHARWCEGWRSWMVYNGRHWEQDRTGAIDRMAKKTVRSIYHEVAEETDDEARKALLKHARASESNKLIRAMLDRAKSELPTRPEEFNAQLNLINCKNGTLDLRTRELRPHSPDDMLTKCLKIAYNPLASCPKWVTFIQSIFAGEEQVIAFIQEALGMSLSGDISEQCLFICHGAGSNGKTTMLETVRVIMASYATAANIETFQVHKNEGIRNDIAELYGARFVTASENALGSRLNEAFVKKTTGKEPLRARRLHENEFEFMPELTLWLAVNHKPVVRDTSKGMWRRVRFIPFSVTFEGADLNPHLGEELLAEAEGILAWLVAGCIAWNARGRLIIPDSVKKATDAYRSEMDTIALFLQECCDVDRDKKASSTQLLETYKKWCDGYDPKAYDPKMLRQALLEKGFKNVRSTGGRYVWGGLGIVSDNEIPEQQPLCGDEEKEKSEPSEPSELKNQVILTRNETSQKGPKFSSLGSLGSLEEEKEREEPKNRIPDKEGNRPTPTPPSTPASFRQGATRTARCRFCDGFTTQRWDVKEQDWICYSCLSPVEKPVTLQKACPSKQQVAENSSPSKECIDHDDNRT